MAKYRYRKVSTRIWNDETFRNLSDDSKLAFLFLLTHPHMTSIGAMRATIEGLAAELGWTQQRLSKGLAEPLRKGIIAIDERAFCVALPNFAKHNPPENPNVVKSWAGILDLIPECELKSLIVQRLTCAIEGLAEPFREAFETLSKEFRIPEPEPEQEQEQEQEQETDSCSSQEKTAAKELLQKQAETIYKAYPKHTGGTPAKDKIAKVLKDGAVDYETLLAAVQAFAQSDIGARGDIAYCPAPIPWMNKERWNDDPETWKLPEDNWVRFPEADVPKYQQPQFELDSIAEAKERKRREQEAADA